MPTGRCISHFHPKKGRDLKTAFDRIETTLDHLILSGWISAFALLRGSLSVEQKVNRHCMIQHFLNLKNMERSTPLLLPRNPGKIRELVLAEGIPLYCSWKWLQAPWFHCFSLFMLFGLETGKAPETMSLIIWLLLFIMYSLVWAAGRGWLCHKLGH